MEFLYNLSKIRRLRGTDEAVRIIGNRIDLLNVLQNSKNHSRMEILDLIMSTYSGNAYGDANWSKVSGGWTTPEVPTIYGNFRKHHAELEQLSLDPGFITHLPKFMEFLNESMNTNNYLEIREKFRRFLGLREVYRAMVLSEEEIKRIRESGIESPFLMKKTNESRLIEDFEANVLSSYFRELVESHFHGENFHSPLISISSHEDVAIAVGMYFGKKSPFKDLYLFKMNIPEIDLIYYADHAVRKPYKLQSLGDRAILNISVNGKNNSYPFDSDAESYVIHKINPDEITNISKVEVDECSWNGRFYRSTK